jgi:serine/threonine protein kinase
MVSILGGGFHDLTKSHYIVMDFLHGNNLKTCLKNIPADQIENLVAQLASCAKFLEDLNLCHRDIKPENIIILENYTKLVLLDFGVLRPIGYPGLTDGDGVLPFIGTLQYSSPEFLLRAEMDTTEGWRALTFYQIGAVLHDLIMRKELFNEYTQPYARLVNAVQFAQPTIQNSAIDPWLIELARSCLLKDPKNRLRLVNWNSFQAVNGSAKGISAKQRVTNRAMLVQAEEGQVISAPAIDQSQLITETIELLKTSVHLVRQDNDHFPPLDIATRVGKQNRLKIRVRPSTTHLLSGPVRRQII